MFYWCPFLLHMWPSYHSKFRSPIRQVTKLGSLILVSSECRRSLSNCLCACYMGFALSKFETTEVTNSKSQHVYSTSHHHLTPNSYGCAWNSYKHMHKTMWLWFTRLQLNADNLNILLIVKDVHLVKWLIIDYTTENTNLFPLSSTPDMRAVFR